MDYEEDISELQFRLSFPVLVTDSIDLGGGALAYEWAEQVVDPATGDLIELPGGRQGIDATANLLVEANDEVLTDFPFYERAYFRGIDSDGIAVYEFYRTEPPAGGSITVQELDGSPSYAGQTVVRFDSATGLGVQNSFATVWVYGIPAGAAQVGVVDVSAQSFSGQKTFLGYLKATVGAEIGNPLSIGGSSFVYTSFLFANGTVDATWAPDALDSTFGVGNAGSIDYEHQDTLGDENQFGLRLRRLSDIITGRLVNDGVSTHVYELQMRQTDGTPDLSGLEPAYAVNINNTRYTGVSAVIGGSTFKGGILTSAGSGGSDSVLPSQIFGP